MNNCKFCRATADSIDPNLCCACEAAQRFIEHCPRAGQYSRELDEMMKRVSIDEMMNCGGDTTDMNGKDGL